MCNLEFVLDEKILLAASVGRQLWMCEPLGHFSRSDSSSVYSSGTYGSGSRRPSSESQVQIAGNLERHSFAEPAAEAAHKNVTGVQDLPSTIVTWKSKMSGASAPQVSCSPAMALTRRALDDDADLA